MVTVMYIIGVVGLFLILVLVIMWQQKLIFYVNYQRYSYDDNLFVEVETPIPLPTIRFTIPMIDVRLFLTKKFLAVEVADESSESEAEREYSLSYLMRRLEELHRLLPLLKPTIKKFANHTEVDKVKVNAVVGLDEPDKTAVAVGLCQGLLWNLLASLSYSAKKWKDKPEINVIPDFDKMFFSLRIDCIFALKIGDITSISCSYLWSLILRKVGRVNGRTSNSRINE